MVFRVKVLRSLTSPFLFTTLPVSLAFRLVTFVFFLLRPALSFFLTPPVLLSLGRPSTFLPSGSHLLSPSFFLPFAVPGFLGGSFSPSKVRRPLFVFVGATSLP